MAYEFDTAEDGANVMRPVVVPGDGWSAGMMAAAIEAGETPVTRSCPSCGDSPTPAWLPGLVPPL
jgi:hypothetical protein